MIHIPEEYAGAVLEATHAGRWVLTPVHQWLYRDSSPYQHIAIGDVPYLGRCLFLDGWLQFAEADEFIYHEHLVLPALLAHPEPRDVLILGGGDGLALRETWRHPAIRRAVMVELDQKVVDVCREHLGELQRGALLDPRLQLIIGDARDYLKETPDTFDVVFIDLIDLMPDTLELYEDIFTHIRQILSPHSLVVVHGPDPGPPLYEGLFMIAFLHRHFPHVAWYKAFITSFAETWSFAIGSHTETFLHLPAETWEKRARQNLDTLPRSFVPNNMPAFFRHPPEEEERLEALLQGKFAPRLEDWPATLLSRQETLSLLQKLKYETL